MVKAPAQGGEAGDSACHLQSQTRVNAQSSSLVKNFSVELIEVEA
jgi:hypothetical protein